MNKLTYREAYDKIIDAYFKDEIKPFDSEFCFCGTLNNGNRKWNNQTSLWLPYSYLEFKAMELPLLNIICEGTLGRKWKHDNGDFVKPITQSDHYSMEKNPNYENALFAGMCAALEVLKQIHRARNENVDDLPLLTKRKLETCK